MTGLEAQCTPHECWDREKTDPVITQHQNLKLKISYYEFIYFHFPFSLFGFWVTDVEEILNMRKTYTYISKSLLWSGCVQIFSAIGPVTFLHAPIRYFHSET